MTERLYTTQEIADASGITTARVRRLAIDLNKGRKYGRDRLFTEADRQWFLNRPDRRRKDAQTRQHDDAPTSI